MISILLGLLSLFATSEFFFGKAKELHKDSKEVQAYITKTNSNLCETLPFVIREAESFRAGRIINWAHAISFLIAIVFDITVVFCLVI